MLEPEEAVVQLICEYLALRAREQFDEQHRLPDDGRHRLARLDQALAVDQLPAAPHERVFVRFHLVMRAELVGTPVPLAGFVLDMSASGAFVTGAPALPTAGQLGLRVLGEREYRFPARLVRATPQRHGRWGLGLAFTGQPFELRRPSSYRA